MINIAKLLKDCPEGLPLYSLLFGPVVLRKTDLKEERYPIVVSPINTDEKFSFDAYGRYLEKFNDGECLLFPSKDCRTWEGWKAPHKPNFKVNDWIIYDRTFTIPIQIIEVNQKDDIYVCRSIEGLYGNYDITNTDRNYHLWTIRDAADGDVLVSGTDKPFIYNGNIEFSSAGAYIGISRNGIIRLDMFPSKAWTSIKSVKPATKAQHDLLLTKLMEVGYQWDVEKKELHKTVSLKFQVGKWIAYNENRTSLPPKQIIRITGNRYIVDGNCTYDFKTLEADWHLWTIEDAKKGDILYSPCCKLLFIFKSNKECYVGYNLNYRSDNIVVNNPICIPVDSIPASKEQRDLLFKKIKENGYTWDSDKKELRKVKPHYDITNLKPKQWVLVRDDDEWEWALTRFSYLSSGSASLFVCINGASFQQCIPLDGNEKLLGTTDMPKEEYINW